MGLPGAQMRRYPWTPSGSQAPGRPLDRKRQGAHPWTWTPSVSVDVCVCGRACGRAPWTPSASVDVGWAPSGSQAPGRPS
eukprot:9473337-Pyramimonas_sp.AAC.1